MPKRSDGIRHVKRPSMGVTWFQTQLDSSAYGGTRDPTFHADFRPSIFAAHFFPRPRLRYNSSMKKSRVRRIARCGTVEAYYEENMDLVS